MDRRTFLCTAGGAAAAAAAGACARPEAPQSSPAPSGAQAAPSPTGPPRREVYTFPQQAEGMARGLQDAGIRIAYGPNSVPPPPGISAPAQRAWVNLAQLPLPADDPAKLAAVRRFTVQTEDAEFAKYAVSHSLEDRTVNGITTLRITPRALRHPGKALIFIHGGAWIVNSRKTQLPLQCAVADTLGMRVISLEYRLAPEHPYPAALDDVLAAYTGIVEEFQPGDLGIFGTSAGGGLTLATVLRLKAEGLPLPAAAAPLSPGADMTHSGYLFSAVGLNDPVLAPSDVDAAMRAYVAGADPKDPLVSPVFGDYAGAPPLFVLASTAEVIGSDGIRAAQSAQASGVPTTLFVSDGMWHVPIADGSGVPELQSAYDAMVAFFRRHLQV